MMEIPIITTVSELRQLRAKFGEESVGFVPTMGYLHEGHMSLVGRSTKENQHTIISIFVNPSQFAPEEDLDTYPRDIGHDVAVIEAYLKKNGGKVDAIFKPEVNEMYPSGFTMKREEQRGAFVEVLGVSDVLEGKTRPSFFRGVATVVTKLFNAVKPTVAYFGQKDIQQTVVIKMMVRDLLMDLSVVVVPTVRNKSGLALSSRNKYLSDDILKQAECLNQSMLLANESYQKGETDVAKLSESIKSLIEGTNPAFKIDYVAFNDPVTLEYINKIDISKGCILSMAIYVPNTTSKDEKKFTRLIDNMVFNPL